MKAAHELCKKSTSKSNERQMKNGSHFHEINGEYG